MRVKKIMDVEGKKIEFFRVYLTDELRKFVKRNGGSKYIRSLIIQDYLKKEKKGRKKS